MRNGQTRKCRSVMLAAAAGAMWAGSAYGADATWNTNASGNWSDSTKWSTNPGVPGELGTTTNTDAVTIAPVVSGKSITLDAGRNVASIDFNANAGLVTLAGGSLVLTAGGTIQLSGAGGGAGAIVSAPITLAGGATLTSDSSTVLRLLKITGGVTGSASSGTSVLTLNGGNTSTSNAISGTGISDGGNGGLLAVVKDGAGAWALSVANSYTGGTILRNGTLVMSNGGALGSGAVTLENGILRASSGYTVTNDVVLQGSVTYGSDNTFTFNGASFSLGNAAGTVRTIEVSGGATSAVSVSASIANGATANTIRKTGSGTLNLSNNANAYTHLIVEGGSVNASTVISGTGSTYASPTSMGTALGTGKISLNGGSIRVAVSAGGPSGSDYNFGGVSQDIEVLSGGGGIVHSAAARAIMIYSGLISGTGTLRFTNGAGGTQDPNGFALTQTNTFTGGVELNTTANASSARAFWIADAVNALGGGAGGTGGVVSFINSNISTAPSNAIQYLTLKADQKIAGLSGSRSRAYINGYSEATSVTLTINNTAGSAGDGSEYAGFIAAGSPTSIAGISSSQAAGNNLKLVKEGTGTQILTGLNSYTAGTVINGGTLVVNGGATAAVGPVMGTFIASSPFVDIDTTGLVVGQFVFGTSSATPRQIVAIGTNQIQLNANVSGSAGSLAFTFSSLGSAPAIEGITVTTAAAASSTALTVSSSAGLAVGQFIAGTRILGGTQIAAIDGNVLTLSQATSSGGTVTLGTALQIPGISGTGGGVVTVNGGRLAGSGGIVGAVTVNNGGRIAPGSKGNADIGTLRTGTLTLGAGATYEVNANLDSAVVAGVHASDVLKVIGDVTLGGDLYFNFNGFVMDENAPKTILLINNDGTDAVLDPTFGTISSNYAQLGPLEYTLAFNFDAGTGSFGSGNDVAITFSSVPEPATAGLMGLAGVALRGRRKRRTSAQLLG